MGLLTDYREDESRRPIPRWEPTILFTEEDVESIDWDKVFAEWFKVEKDVDLDIKVG